MSKKPKKIKELFTDLKTVKDINKRVEIITHIIESIDKEKDKSAFSDINLEAILDKIKDLESSKDPEKITLWGKFILELIKLFPNYKQRLISRVFKATSSSKFEDDSLKLLLYNTLVSINDITINVDDKKVLESTIVFLLFTHSMKEGSETTLALFKKALIKLDPCNLPYVITEFSVVFFCYQSFKYNYEIYLQIKQDSDNNQETIRKKLIVCFEILDIFQEKMLITKKNIKEILVFLLIFFSGTFSGKASHFYQKFILTEKTVFERELIDLLNENGVLKQLKQLDEAFKNNLILINYIFTGDKHSQVFFSFKEYVDKEGLTQKHHETIQKFIWNSAIEKICVLCWKNNKTKEFDIPNEIIWKSLANLSKEQTLYSSLLNNIVVFIVYFQEQISFEWEHILSILNDIIKEINKIKQIETKRSNSTIKEPQFRKISSTVSHYSLPMSLPNPINIATPIHNQMPTQRGASTSIPFSESENLNEFTEIQEKILKIFQLIFSLDINDAFKGKIGDVMTILFAYPEYSNETIIIWKIRWSLLDNERFSFFISDLFISYFLKEKSNLSREYVLDSIKQHYRKVYCKPSYAQTIETLLLKYIVSSIQAIIFNQFSFSSYSSCLISILNLTRNINFFMGMLNNILSPSSEKLAQEFKKKTIEILLCKLISSFQKNKISLVFQIMNTKMKNIMDNGIPGKDKLEANCYLAETFIYIYNHFYINKHYELQINRENHKKKKLSCIIVHSPDDNDPESKEKELFPYRLIPINYFISFCIFLNDTHQYNEVILPEVLAFFIKQLKFMFFFCKTPELPKFLLQICKNQLSKEDILFKYINKTKIMSRLQQIFMYVNYHYSNLIPNSKESLKSFEGKCFNELLKNEIPNDKLKIEITSLSSKHLESMFNSCLNIIKQYNNYCYLPNNTIKLAKLTEDSQLNYMVYFEGMTFEMNLRFIQYFFSLLEFYFFSLTDFSINENTTVNFHSSSKVDNKTDPKQLIVSLFAHFLILLKKYKQLIVYQYDIAFFLLKIIFTLKDLLLSYNEERIIEIIYLIVSICWPNYEKEWTNHFKKEFPKIRELPSLKTEKKEGTKQDIIKRNLLVEGFGDAVIMFFFEKITNGNKMLRIFQKVLENPESSLRQRIFLDLCKWNLTSRANRDNIKSIYRRKQATHAEVYYDNLNLITIIPVNAYTVEMIIRNPIANINMTINSPPSIWKKEENADTKLESLLNKKPRKSTEELSSSVSKVNQSAPNCSTEDGYICQQLRLDDSNTYQNQKEYIFLSLYKQLSSQNFTNNDITNSIQENDIQQLDSSSVYISANCSILYYPDIPSFNSQQLFSYQGPLSVAYVNFINSLGKTFAINEENANIFLVNDNFKDKKGLYSIYHQDTVFQIIFFCLNLICPKDPKEIEETRKYFFDLNLINIVWMDNPYAKFNNSFSDLDQTLVYIIINPYSSSHYYIKLKFIGDTKVQTYKKIMENSEARKMIERFKKVKIDVIKMIKKYIQFKMTIYIGKDGKELANYLQKIIIIINTIVNYGLKKSIYENQTEKESSINIQKSELKDISFNNWYSRSEQLIGIDKKSHKHN